MPGIYDESSMSTSSMGAIGTKLQAIWDTYKKDKYVAEMTALQNLRQFKGIYDPEVKSRIPDDQSTAYPKLTRQKVVGTIARLMEMLFPQTEKNYEVTNSPVPNLSQPDLQTVLNKLVEEKGDQLTDEMIETAVVSFAKEKAKRLDTEIQDQLDELDFVQIARRIVRSAVLYGKGTLRGPMIVMEEGRTWSKGADNTWVASTVQKKRPFFEEIAWWDFYTDMSAKSLDHTDADIVRRVVTKTQLKCFAKESGFIAAQIEAYLANHPTGNHKELHWEQALRSEKSDKSNVTDISGRKYELLEFWMRFTVKELRECGVASTKLQGLADTDELEANIWIVENFVIKALLNPYDGRIRGFHHFIYEEDELNLLGNGLPTVMRDSQLAVSDAARMILDNGSVVCGPMLEINHQRLAPGQDLDVYARKAWIREDDGTDASVPAVREINIKSHIPELIDIINLFMGFADAETALPPPALGDVSGQGKESLRTTGNLSMLLGAAALPIRDTVRNYDKFTTSVVGSLCYWNNEFNPNEALKGDFTVIARGSTSLIAKEVRATSLDQFMMTIDAEDKMYLNRKKVLMERMKVRDLPLDLLEEDDVVTSKLEEQARIAQEAAASQKAMQTAEIRGIVAASFKDLMNGLKAQAGANSEVYNTLIEGMIHVREAERDAASEGAGGAASAAPSKQPARSGVAGAR